MAGLIFKFLGKAMGKAFTGAANGVKNPKMQAKMAEGWKWAANEGKDVAMGAGKMAVKGSGTVLNAAGKFAQKHPLTTGVVGTIGYSKITGEPVSKLLTDDDGLLKTASQALAGVDNLAEATSILLLGKENTEEIKDTVKDATSKAVEKGQEIKEGVSNTVENIKEGLNPGAAEGAVTGVGGFSQMLSNVLGTNVNFNLPNVFMTMAAAWLTFGNFGFTGKIAGALLGALGLKNMFQAPSLAPAIANGQSQQQEQTEEQTVEPMVNTGRAVVPNMQTIGNDEMNGPDYDNGENPEETTRRGFRR